MTGGPANRLPFPASAMRRIRCASRWLPRLAATYAMAMLAGLLAAHFGIPLPWMLGPLFLAAALSGCGVGLRILPMGRELGQITVGLAVGLLFTPETLAVVLGLLPAMIGATLYVIGYTLVAALLFRPLAAVDADTAFFATAAGGMADMAVIAADRGGDASSVAMVHALRVATVVAVVPFLVVALSEPGAAAPAAATGQSQDAVLLAVCFGLAILAALALRATPIPNPWLVGPLLFGIALSASGLLSVAVPSKLIVLAQIMIGVWLGCRFQRQVLMRLPRAAVAGLVMALFMLAAAAAGAVALAAVTGLPFSTCVLALAPAAMTEMAITAKAMHLDVQLVTAFHVMRIATISSTVLLVYAGYQWMVRPRRGAAAGKGEILHD